MKYHIFFFLPFLTFMLFTACAEEKQSITIEEVTHRNTPHFKITTPGATWYYEKMSGGFSSLIDPDGNDWINWSKLDTAGYPKSAAADYRGLPNMVYGGDQGGIGHPGFDKCTSSIVNDSTVETISNNGNYRWQWTFTSNAALFNIQKIDTSRNYWFLYEGTPGGRFAPNEIIWGTENGIHDSVPDYYKGGTIQDTYDWIFFGDDISNYTLYIEPLHKDTLPDIMGFLGNTREGLNSPDGMVVLGFGRNRQTQPLYSKPHKFLVGLADIKVTDNEAYENLKAEIKETKALFNE